MLNVLNDVAKYIFVIPVCIGLLKWNALDKPLRWVWFNPFLSLLIGMASQITANQSINNHFLFYILAIISPVIYLGFYLQLITKSWLRSIMKMATMVIVLLVIFNLVRYGIVAYYSTSFIISDILLIIISLWVMQNSNLTRPLRIINWGIFAYLLMDLTYSLLSTPLYNYLQNKFLIILSYGITPLFIILLALTYSYAFWIKKDSHPPDFNDIQALKSQ